jgi:transcriptional regulator with XRE-family HTH domain
MPISNEQKAITSGERAAQANQSATVAGYERKMRGLSLDEVSKRTGIDVDRVQRLENGEHAYIYGSEAPKLERVLGHKETDLRKPLTDEFRTKKLDDGLI